MLGSNKAGVDFKNWGGGWRLFWRETAGGLLMI